MLSVWLTREEPRAREFPTKVKAREGTRLVSAPAAKTWVVLIQFQVMASIWYSGKAVTLYEVSAAVLLYCYWTVTVLSSLIFLYI